MTTQQIVEEQRNFFDSGATLDTDFRIAQLKKLKQSIFDNLNALIEAFKTDYNKCEFDCLSTEVGMVVKEINYFIKNIKRLARPKRVMTSLLNFPSGAKIVYQPLGVVLIVSPWNYPFQLTMAPVVGAIAGGNTMVVKPSSKTPSVAKVMTDILSVFEPNYVFTNSQKDLSLYDLRYDMVFYTGSADFAKTIMEKQAKFLTPCVLELGGKSPCIVDSDADIEIAAKRIAWGKFLNGGQTCVAPDYCVVHSSVKAQFVQRLLFYIQKFYYTGQSLNDDYPYLVSAQKAQEMLQLIKEEKIICGGKVEGDRKMHPTVLDDITFDSPIMKNEIFAPVLPILTFDGLKQLLNKLKTMEKPLALYYFSQSKAACDIVQQQATSGGGCANDVIMHLTEEKLPFGGVGNSGMGSYHGKKSFETFTHAKSVLFKGKNELEVKYPPYTKEKTNFLRGFFKLPKNKKD